jgi:hypothetical protein
MRAAKYIPVLLALGASVGALFQWQSIAKLRSQNSALREVESANSATNGTNSLIAPATEDLQKLRRENEDLLRLRNEVRQLRSRMPELTEARAENQRLLQAIHNPSIAAAPQSPTPAGFVAREALADVGLETPEAAVQTFFRALRDGDVQRMHDCTGDPRLTPKEFEKKGEAMGQKMNEEMQSFSDFKIAERKEISTDEVQLGLQSSRGPAIFRMTFRRIGNQWILVNK